MSRSTIINLIANNLIYFLAWLRIPSQSTTESLINEHFWCTYFVYGNVKYSIKMSLAKMFGILLKIFYVKHRQAIHLSLGVEIYPHCKFPRAQGILKYVFNEALPWLASVNLAGIWTHKINTKSKNICPGLSRRRQANAAYAQCRQSSLFKLSTRLLPTSIGAVNFAICLVH